MQLRLGESLDPRLPRIKAVPRFDPLIHIVAVVFRRRGLGRNQPVLRVRGYYFTGALDQPVVGKAAHDNAMKAVEESRQNVKTTPLRPDRLFVAPSGDMAYEYGTEQVSFDERASGKHRDFTTAYLRVWRAVDGQCKIAALMAQREGKENR